MSTKIQWTDETWSPVVGCSPISPGCKFCWAQGQAHRGLHPRHRGLTVVKSNGVKWNGTINLAPERLETPLHWRKHRRVFVCSMSDLFHEEVPFEYAAAVFGVMAAARDHTFQVLTKRTQRMADFFAWIVGRGSRGYVWQSMFEYAKQYGLEIPTERMESPWPWPLPNVWIGTSCEDQRRYDERIGPLLDCPAAIRYLSCEPLLDRIDLGLGRNRPDQRILRWHKPISRELHWAIIGGESGHKARPCALEWVEELVEQCAKHQVACFVKQLGATVVSEERMAETLEDAKIMCGEEKRDRWLWYAGLADGQGGDPAEWPEQMQVRQFPEEERPDVRA